MLTGRVLDDSGVGDEGPCEEWRVCERGVRAARGAVGVAMGTRGRAAVQVRETAERRKDDASAVAAGLLAIVARCVQVRGQGRQCKCSKCSVLPCVHGVLMILQVASAPQASRQ